MNENGKLEPEDDPGLSRAWRSASGEQPPAHVDVAILAAARRSVRSAPRPPRSARFAGWRVPVSMAAVLVLCVGLVLNLRQQTDIPLPAGSPSLQDDSADGDFTGGEAAAEMQSASPTAAPAREEKSVSPDRAANRAPEAMSSPPARLLLREPAVDGERRARVTADPDSGSGQDLAASAPALPPADWLHEIRRLWDADKRAEALQQLTQFRQQYPEYDKPALQQALGKALLEEGWPQALPDTQP